MSRIIDKRLDCNGLNRNDAMRFLSTSGAVLIDDGRVDIAAEIARRLRSACTTVDASSSTQKLRRVRRVQVAKDYMREAILLNGTLLDEHVCDTALEAGLVTLEETLARALQSAAAEARRLAGCEESDGPTVTAPAVAAMVSAMLHAGCRTGVGEEVLLHVMARLAPLARCVAVVDKTGESLHALRTQCSSATSAAAAATARTAERGMRASIECGATQADATAPLEIWARVRVPFLFHIFRLPLDVTTHEPVAVLSARIDQHYIFDVAQLQHAAQDYSESEVVGTKTLREIHTDVLHVHPTFVPLRSALALDEEMDEMSQEVQMICASSPSSSSSAKKTAAARRRCEEAQICTDAAALSDEEWCYTLDVLTTQQQDAVQISAVDISGCLSLGDTSIIFIADAFSNSLATLKLALCSEVSDVSIIRVAAQCGATLTQLDLGWCAQLTDAAVERIAASCSLLESLSISECNYVTDASIVCIAESCPALRELVVDWCIAVGDASLHAIAQHSRQLAHLSCRFCTSVSSDAVVDVAQNCAFLETLELVGCSNVSARALAALAEHCHWLASLDVSGCALVDDDAIVAIASACTQLTSLGVATCALLSDNAILAVAERSRALTALNVDGCEALTDASLLAFVARGSAASGGGSAAAQSASPLRLESGARALASLRELHLQHCPRLTKRVLSAVVQRCPGIQTLRLSSESIDVDEAAILALACGCPALERLSLAGCARGVSVRALKAIADACPLLTDLDVSGCTGVTIDALIYAAHACPALRDVDVEGCAAVGDAALARFAALGVAVHGV